MASILDTLQAELRRVMIAGANAAAEDTKLSKLAQDLKAAGGKAPVLTRLAEQTEALISQSGTKSTILLDEAVLVASIATTQAATDRKGDLNLSEAENDLIFVKRSYRDTKALINALTTKGGGRQSIIQNELGSGTAYDSRLLPLFVGALDDSYSEIANDIAKGLSKFGRQAIEPPKAVIDISTGTDSSTRKLEALASPLNNDEKEALFMDIYTNGNSKLKPLAIRNLTDIKHDEIHKTALKSKNDQIREAAFYALAARQDEEAAQILADALATKDYAMAVEAADAHKHQKTLDLYKAMVEEMIDSDAPLTKETTHRIGVYQTHTNGGYEVLLKIYRYYNNREKWLVFDNYADSYYSNYIAGALRSMLYIDAERALADIAAMTDEEGIPDNTYSYMVRYGLEQLTPDKLYTALEPFLEHERLKNSLISEFEYCLNVQRYLRISLKEVKN